MTGIILHMLKAAIKDKLFLGVSAFLLISTSFSFFLGYNALVEKLEASIVYSSSIARIIAILGYAIFLSFYFKKLIENKEIELFLSKRISRQKIIYSFFIGAKLLFLPIVLIILIFFSILGVNFVNSLFWSLSLFLEYLIIISFTIFFSILMTSSVNGMMMIFLSYILSRAIGSFISYIQFKLTFGIYDWLQYLLKLISIFIPRLDLFTKSSWLLYGDFIFYDFLLIVLQSLVFSSLLLHFTIFDFNKKDF